MRCIITIDMDNDAWRNDPMSELSAVLSDLARAIRLGEDGGDIRDANGISVGSITITEVEP